MGLLQSLIHIIIFFERNTLHFSDSLQFYGFMAFIAFITLALLSVIRRSMFEIFQTTHLALAVLITYALWRHLTVRPSFSRFYVCIASGIFVLTTALRYSRLILRNVIWGQPYTTAKVTQVRDSVRIQVIVPRPWKVRAGEYLYIWMPGVSIWSIFQSHPFMVTWWDNDVDGKSTNIYLLIKPASGFTQKLVQYTGNCVFRSWIDGPYGQPSNVGDYGNILMFASGIGITAQIPHLKELLRGYRNYRVRTRNILLVWQLDKESDQEWVQDWMTELLSEDQGAYILKIGLYVLRNFDNQNTSYGDMEDYGEHNRVRKLYGRPDVDRLIKSEVAKKRGQLLIMTSTGSDMQEQIQRSTQKYLDREVKLTHLAFQPRSYRSFWSPRLPEVNYKGVV
ncbi:hypothetical protein ACLMJK_007684 [Lecanora helva]